MRRSEGLACGPGTLSPSPISALPPLGSSLRALVSLGLKLFMFPIASFPIHSGEPHYLYTYVYIVADPHYWLSLMKQRVYKRDRENNSWILSSDSTVHDLPGGSA